MSCVVGVWLVELPSSSIMYWEVPRLIVTKTNRVTQAIVCFRRHFLCGALLCNCSPAKREVYLHMYSGNVSRTLHAQHSVTTNLNISPRFSPTICYRDADSVPTSSPFYSNIDRLYAQNPVFKIVREESVKVNLQMYSGNDQQNLLCVESCFTKEYSISPGSRQRCLIP